MNLNGDPNYDDRATGRRTYRETSFSASSRDWRCHDCGKLLGKCNGQQMHIRRKSVEFMASFPITAKCPGCGALNSKNKA